MQYLQHRLANVDEILYDSDIIICLMICTQDTKKQNWPATMHLSYLFVVAAIRLLSSVCVVCANCGYVRGPLSTTNDTVVINIDCSQSMPLSHYVPLQLPDNATHIAVQLVHCHTVPVGLFTDVTASVMSVTVASEDAVQLLIGTFEGLQLVSKLRLLGFTQLKSVSQSLLESLRNIHTLIFEGFGRDNIALSYLGSVIQRLTGTPIRRLVLSRIKDSLFFQQPIMKLEVFKISNASVKELIITDVPFNYEGSIRLAFPKLVCFCAQKGNASLPSIWDLILLADDVKEIVIYRTNTLPADKDGNDLFHIPLNEMLPAMMKTVKLYRDLYSDLINYIHNRLTANVAEN